MKSKKPISPVFAGATTSHILKPKLNLFLSRNRKKNFFGRFSKRATALLLLTIQLRTLPFMLFLLPKPSLPVHRLTPRLPQRTAFSTQRSSEQESYFHYNSGRWLYNEKERECRTSHLKVYHIKSSMQNWLLGL